MWPWLRTKIAHGKLAYQRGKGWGGEALVAGAVAALAVRNEWAISLSLFVLSVILFTAVGHVDRKYLKLWQEENRQGSEVNPFMVGLNDSIKRIERDVNVLVRNAAEQAKMPES